MNLCLLVLCVSIKNKLKFSHKFDYKCFLRSINSISSANLAVRQNVSLKSEVQKVSCEYNRLEVCGICDQYMECDITCNKEKANR